MSDENLPNGTGSEPITAQPPEETKAPEETPATPIHEVVNVEKTLKERVEDAFEEFRAYLVHLIGDIHGVNKAVDDAKVTVAPHVSEENK